MVLYVSAVHPLVCEIIEISLNEYDRCSFVSGTARQITERADQVCQTSWSCSLRSHVSDQVVFLFTDFRLDCLLQLLSLQLCKIIVCQIFQLQFIRSPLQSWGVCRRNTRVRKLPDFPDRILKAPSPYTITSTCFPHACSTCF